MRHYELIRRDSGLEFKIMAWVDVGYNSEPTYSCCVEVFDPEVSRYRLAVSSEEQPTEEELLLAYRNLWLKLEPKRD